jgi:hypothetical protein
MAWLVVRGLQSGRGKNTLRGAAALLRQLGRHVEFVKAQRLGENGQQTLRSLRPRLEREDLAFRRRISAEAEALRARRPELSQNGRAVNLFRDFSLSSQWPSVAAFKQWARRVKIKL